MVGKYCALQLIGDSIAIANHFTDVDTLNGMLVIPKSELTAN